MSFRKVTVVLLLLAGAGSAYVAAALLAPPTPGPVSSAVDDAGVDARHAFASPIPSVHDLPPPPGWVVVAESRALWRAEREALHEHAEAGGSVLLITPHPEAALRGDQASQIRFLPGSVYTRDGAARSKGTISGGVAFEVSGIQAIDIAASPFETFAVSGPDAFRDTNRNGLLELGEPAGPFVVAARIAVGGGRIIVVAAPVPGEVGGDLVRAILGETDGDVLVLDEGSRDPLLGPAAIAAFAATIPQLHPGASTALAAVAFTVVTLLALPSPERERSADDRVSRLIAAAARASESRETRTSARLIKILNLERSDT